MKKTCRLTLSDGSSLEGKQVGAAVQTSGEMVFTTGMVGYTEAITDPSYYGQILVFAYPLIGNYGVPKFDGSVDYRTGFESAKIHASAVVFHKVSESSYHWESDTTIDEWLKSQNVPGIMGVDTRHLVTKIRSISDLFGRISYDQNTSLTRYETEDKWFNPNIQPVVQHVSCKESTSLGKGKIKIGLIDLGVKWNIVRQFKNSDVEVVVIPWDSDLASIECDGWLISNGPGNPQLTGDVIANVSSLLTQTRPILGICLGHQILALAAGATTSKMTFGHRSHNQPVMEVGTKNGFITSQNHSYVVDEIPPGWEPWFTNINDQSIEGIKHQTLPFSSVQFHPEAAGGPRDTSWIIQEFIAKVKKHVAI